MHHDANETKDHATDTGETMGGAYQNQSSPIGRSLIDLEKLGRLWATHGIRMGVAALQTSAVTLTQVASTLTTLAEGLKAQPAPEDDEHPVD